MVFYLKLQNGYNYICTLKLKIMKQFIIYCLCFIFALNVAIAQEFNKKYFDKMVGGEILIDQCNRTGLEDGAFGEIFSGQYAEYNPDLTTINDLKNRFTNITVKMVFGSWCHDSKMQVPRFMKVLDQIGFDDKLLTIIGVDRLKKAHDLKIKKLKIKYVPTFIVYRDNIEIGRIVESPKKSLEQDLLKILQ